MASKLPHPSAFEDFRKFRDRIRESVPKGPVDGKWVIGNLGIKQMSNATTLVSALVGAGFLNEDGSLSDRGNKLRRSNEDVEYRTAIAEAITALLGEDREASIRAGIITRAELPGNLRDHFGVGDSVVTKFLLGLRWLAQEAGDDIIAAVSTKDSSKATGSTPKPKSGTSKRISTPKGKKLEVEELTGDDDKGVVDSHLENGSSIPLKTGSWGTPILSSGIINFNFDSGWRIQDVQASLRMIQMIALGELIPSPVTEVNGD